VILVSLKEGHPPSADYVRRLREVLPAAFPSVIFYFQAADMTTQILNFGLPAQIDVRVVGRDRATNLRVAGELRRRIAAIPGIADAHLQQELDAPAFMAKIDRSRALQLGLNAQTIATDLNTSLSSSEQVAPNFWTDPASGIPYYIAVQTPEHLVSSLGDLGNTPVSTAIALNGPPIPGLLSNVATLQRDSVPTNLNQTNIQPVYDVYASVQGRDLGSISDDIGTVVAELQKEPKPGNTIQVLGQIQSMRDAFTDLGIGLLFAAAFVYLLMVVNYQNFGDPFVVILALPATLCGIVTLLFITGTTLSVPSLMGAIMAVGVASANSILLVTFAREEQLNGRSAFRAAINAGHTRIRPVLMTAAATIVGMVPMAIGGAGEEQNAALARAVIGGLLFATPTTLLIVPYLFAMLRKRNDGVAAYGVFEDLQMYDLGIDRDIAPAPKRRRRARRRWGGRLFALGGFLLLAGGLSLGAWGREGRQQQVMATAQQERDFVPSLRVAQVEPSPGTMLVTLPGTTAAFAAANIYARATGYIAKRNVDIGSRVKAGDLLVEINAPELDHQIQQSEGTLAQMQASLEQAKANRDLAQVTWERDNPLVQKGWVTPQQGDTDRLTLQARDAAVNVAQSNIAAQKAQLRVLNQQKAYQTVVAPFDGVITQRNVDIGVDVQADATSGTFMFEIMQKDVIRVWVYVPQDAAFGVAPGVDAVVHVPELPDREFPGTVTRIADAQQSGTRTLLTEIDLPNQGGVLRSGVYCIVELKIPRGTPSFVVPAEAMIFNRNGLQVGVVNNGKAEIHKVRVTRDMGTSVEVDSGVQSGDQVILNPPVNLFDGSKVQVRGSEAVATN
jgi:RND family efflux transporter MFP subunit